MNNEEFNIAELTLVGKRVLPIDPSVIEEKVTEIVGAESKKGKVCFFFSLALAVFALIGTIGQFTSETATQEDKINTLVAAAFFIILALILFIIGYVRRVRDLRK